MRVAATYLCVFLCPLLGAAVAVAASVDACPDHKAMMDFFTSTHGPDWSNNDGWGTDSDCCTWAGVMCTGGRVTNLLMDTNNLGGMLPETIADLSALETASLGFNDGLRLTSLPASFAQIRTLKSLDVDSNFHNGPIPDLSGASALVDLDLSTNRFSGSVPTWLGAMPSLQNVYLFDNELTGAIPRELSSAQFIAFDVSDNQLTGLVPAFDTSKIEHFDVSNNNLTAVDGMLAEPPSLRYCSFKGNNFACPLPQWTMDQCGATCA